MVHSAYDSFDLLTNSPSKIESIESYGSKLLLGCSDGSLLVYAPEQSASAPEEMRKEAYVLERKVNGFAKKAVMSMQVVESREFLLSLSESIAFHKLPTFETIAVITKAKGANAFCWDEHRGFLCFARQKRVCIFRHDGGRGFVEVKDFGVPDVVKSMSWCGENICLGIRKAYMILNATSGSISEVFTSGRLAPPLVVSLPSGELLLGKINRCSSGAFLGQHWRHCGSKRKTSSRRYAHYLFDNGSYEESMEHFLASQVDITYVLSLYTSIILPKTTIVHDSDKLDIFGDPLHLSRGSSMSDDMEPSSASNMSELDDNAELESKKMSHNMLMALIKFLHKKRHSIIEKATAEGTEEVVFDAVGNNFESYNSNRFKKINKRHGSIPVSSEAREMASILDTALLQAMLLTGQPSMAENLLRGLNYCDLKICEEILQEGSYHVALVELYRRNSMHREALEIINKSVKESESSQSKIAHRFKPEAIIEYLKPLCETDPTLVLEYSMLVLESCPTQTIELFLSGNIPADMVNLYLKQHAPNLQATYLELVLSMNEGAVSGTLQNEMVHLYLSEVLDWHADLSSEQKWDEKVYSPKRKKLLSALESISGYNPEAFLKLLPSDALYEERAILLGKMNQHELALSLYVHKLHVPELALSYCDHVYESAHKSSVKSLSNIYLMLLQIYLNPRRTTKNYEKKISNLFTPRSKSIRKVTSKSLSRTMSRGSKKIAAIEIAEDVKASQSSDSGRSDADTEEFTEEEGTSIMLDEALDLLSRRWDRINGAQALKLLPKETKLQNLLPILGPLVRKSSEMYRNCSVVRSLRQSENLQVKDELYNKRKAVIKISDDNMCSLCHKKIGTSVFAVYPNGKTLVHFVCFRDSQSMKAVAKVSPLKKAF